MRETFPGDPEGERREVPAEEAEGEEAEVDADGSEPEVITEKKEEIKAMTVEIGALKEASSGDTDRLTGELESAHEQLRNAQQSCEQLRAEGVEHFHFYTLNQTDLCLDISLALGASLRRAA